MKILNISSIIPLEGLKRENDIVLRVQDYLFKEYHYEFTILKALPFTPKIFGLFSQKWRTYNKYLKIGKLELHSYKGHIYPWIMPPTSNLWINYVFLPLNLVYFHLYLKKKLLPYAKNSSLILAQNNFPDAVLAYLLSKRSNTPYILNVRGDFNEKILKMPFLNKIYSNANDIITHSPQNYNKLHSLIKIKLLPHPIDQLFFMSKPKKTTRKVELVTVCRLLKLKNIDLVINTLGKLKNQNYSFIYNIVGDGPELNKLKEQVILKKLENEVIFHGYKNSTEVKKFLTESKVFIMPSYPETLGRSFLEAAASNCLIIGHENTGVDGLLRHKKSAIFVSKSTIYSELKSVFDNYSDEYLHEYSVHARYIIDNLTWENIGVTYHNLFNKQLNV